MVINFLSFCLFGKGFIFPFWRTVLPDTIFLVGSLFLSAFKYITTLLSGLTDFCWEIHLIVLWWFPCTWVAFFFHFQNILFAFPFDSLIIISFSVDSLSFFSLRSLGFLDLDVHFLLQIWGVFSRYFFEWAFWSFLSSVCILVCLLLSHSPLIFLNAFVFVFVFSLLHDF